MDFGDLSGQAQARMDGPAWAYYQGTAGRPEDADRDETAWHYWDLVPRALRGVTAIDTTVTLHGNTFSTPIMVAATAGHRLAHPDGEIATGRAATAAGALMTYSSSAGVEITEFGATMTAPWWAQVYVMKDRGRTQDYLDRLVAAGPAAVVLTVDNPGTLGDAPFRASWQSKSAAMKPGNYPGLNWPQMSALIEPGLTLDHIGELAETTGLPVYVKGISHPRDAAAAATTGAAGIVVSNHGRRQLGGVIPTAHALPGVLQSVAGRVPVLVDGGVRSGVDVLRALALGATAVGVGRPVLWGLAADGVDGVTGVLEQLTAELKQAMAAVGAGALADLTPDLVRAAR